MIDYILVAIASVIGAFLYGNHRGALKREAELREQELENAIKVLEVRPSPDVSSALERLQRNGKLTSVPPTAPGDQLKLPL